MDIKKKELTHLVESFLSDFYSKLGDEISLSDDLYYDLSLESKYNVPSTPEYTIGSIKEDIEYLMQNHVKSQEFWANVDVEKMINLILAVHNEKKG